MNVMPKKPNRTKHLVSLCLDEIMVRMFYREVFEVRKANLMLRTAEARVDKISRSRKPGTLRGFG